MNKLQLVDAAMRECRVPRTRLTTTIGTTGQIEQFVAWVDTAWSEIQGLHDEWGWLRDDFSFNTVSGTGDYTLANIGATDRRFWLTDTFRLYKTALGQSDEQFVYEWDYPVFRDTYRYGPQVDQRPFNFAINPKDSSILLGPKPDDVYTVYGEYIKHPGVLTLDTDEPPLKEHLQMIIVYGAMSYYGLEQGAAEVIARAERGYSRLLNQLEREELPDVTFGEPMA